MNYECFTLSDTEKNLSINTSRRLLSKLASF